MNDRFKHIADPLIRTGVTEAVQRTLIPAMSHPAYPGHFCVTADGSHFGTEVTWPGLDSWEIAGAYLLLGYQQLVLDYFNFVRASQRQDGNIPFAIFPADTKPDGTQTYLRGLHYPRDVYQFGARKWIGLFDHWQIHVNPLSTLAPICYILTAGEIADSSPPQGWLQDSMTSIDKAGEYVLSRASPNGLISGAGFYIECPPRNQWDGITQCYAAKAFTELARLCDMQHNASRARYWLAKANQMKRVFNEIFWKGDHFAEYVHPEKGVVDLRSLTDVNFAAIGLNVAGQPQAQRAWRRLQQEESFCAGGMPTQLVAQPSHYQDWELPEPLPFHHVPGPLYDVAAMGRVWYLDVLASKRMQDWPRIKRSTRLVCERGQTDDWQWHERYHAQGNNSVAKGPKGYCEYPAILVRLVLQNLPLFSNPDIGL